MADVDAFSTAVSSTSLTLDLGLLLSVDTSAPRSTSARESTQALVNAIFGLPTTRHPDHGPLATLPAPSTPLPRAKAMPKPKPLTKWEKFAATKGIQKRKKDKLIYDEDTQTWVPRWGYGGANKKVEEQWIHEVKGDENPRALARKERMDRKGKNEKQRLRNEAAAKTQTSVDRNAAKASLDAAVLRSRASTASMGKFDRRLDGETKQKGIKRKVRSFLRPALIPVLLTD